MMMIIPENREIDSFDNPIMLALVLVFVFVTNDNNSNSDAMSSLHQEPEREKSIMSLMIALARSYLGCRTLFTRDK
eukprot:scaffold360_cov262-Chaetoceros_neogracile.AAC.5